MPHPFRSVALLALLFGSAVPLARAQVVVDLRAEAPADSVDFIVQRVYDARPDTATIGTAQTGLFNTERDAVLAGGVPDALRRYFQTRYLAPADATPLAVRVTALRVSEHTSLKEVGTAEVQLEVYRIEGDRLGRVFAGGAVAERQGMDVTRYHDDNLADALDRTVELFRSSGWRSVTPAYEPDTAAARPLVAAAAPLRPARAVTHRTAYLLTPIAGRNGTGGGFTWMQYRADRDWAAHLSLNLAFLGAESPDGDVSGLFANFGPALGVVRRLGPSPFALLLNLQVPFGTETIDYGGEQEENFFIGGRLSQMLALIPRERGLVLGVGLYQSAIAGSELYPNDAGFQFHVGFQN
jgi:hypothetical protein